ncbi:MAG TPA: fumarate reductase subunit FrdD [Jiangellaceae bacterium]|nr:fumarate reductase subunit FrdD [Jiangellaceae bacterium]
MTRRTAEPYVWLLFSAGGVLAAVFVPVLLFAFGLAFPLGWITPPDHDHLHAVLSHPLTLIFLLVLCVLLLIHSAHRLRHTLDDMVLVERLEGPIAALCYGGALLGAVATVYILAGLL